MNHRYRLAHSKEIKRNRWNNVCPSCGHRGKFSPYIDIVTNEPIAPKECGRCCREKSCAYHMTPKEWFKEHPTEKREWLPREQYVELMRQRRREARVASPPDSSQARLLGADKSNGAKAHSSGELKFSSSQVALSYRATIANDAPFRVVSQGEGASSAMPVSPLLRRGRGEAASYLSRMSTLCHKSRSDKNNLARWLCTQFSEEQVAEVLARYRTGSTRDGRIIYWQIDECGQVRAGKVMAYDLDGHRMKDGKGNVCWVHSMKIGGIRFDEMLAPQCLFGEHLAPLLSPQGGKTAMPEYSPLGEIEGAAIVESEKTALIMSLVCPDKVWLATGGKANFKESMLAPLIGLEVTVYPDADALHDWYIRAVEMNRTLGTRLHIPTGYYNLMDHDEARREGRDLADILLREEGK